MPVRADGAQVGVLVRAVVAVDVAVAEQRAEDVLGVVRAHQRVHLSGLAGGAHQVGLVAAGVGAVFFAFAVG